MEKAQHLMAVAKQMHDVAEQLAEGSDEAMRQCRPM